MGFKTVSFSHSMTSNQHGISIRVAVHGLFKSRGQVLLSDPTRLINLDGSSTIPRGRGPRIYLLCRVLDDGDPQGIVISEVAELAPALGDALDLLDVADLEARVRAVVALDQERHEHGPLAVRVDAAAGAALKGGQEERRAGRWLQLARPS